MLIEFSVGNFRSFKTPVTLSMVAAKIHSRDRQVDQNNTIHVDDDLTLLASAGIYGANASGKSNLIQAFQFVRWFVLNSSKATQAGDRINIVPFRLAVETEKQPSFFELVFLIGKTTYRYGFEVDSEQVVSEWLFHAPFGKEARLFIREENEIHLARAFKGGASSKNLTRPNALFLSVAAQFNSETARQVLGWFQSLRLISGLDDASYSGFTVSQFTRDEAFRQEIIRLIKKSNVDIDGVITEKTNQADLKLPANLPSELKDLILKRMAGTDEVISFKTLHTKWGANGLPESSEVFSLADESEGTQKLFLVLGPFIDTLSRGSLLVIDEIEARLHTQLTNMLVNLFNSKSTNPNGAQLIFATHDTNLLSNKLFRRDQIWFVEKDVQGASHLYSLVELKVRNDASFEKDYLEGRYGALPLLGELRRVVLEAR